MARTKKNPDIEDCHLIEDIEFLLSLRTHPEHIANRLGRTPAALEAKLRRLGRDDLARPFSAAVTRERAARERGARNT